MKEELYRLLKEMYDSGFEDGFVDGSSGVRCNDFDDVIYENIEAINKLLNSQNEIQP